MFFPGSGCGCRAAMLSLHICSVKELFRNQIRDSSDRAAASAYCWKHWPGAVRIK